MARTAFSWTEVFERTGRSLRGSEIREMLSVTERPGVISFGGGLPAPELFPIAGLRAAFDAVLREDGAGALQYGPTTGHRPLRELIAQRLGRRGIECSPDDVLITTGSQQALDLLGRVLAAPHSPVLVESPGYVGALQAFRAFELEPVGLPMDADGLIVDGVARWLDGRRSLGAPPPAFLYTVATYQNPSGVTLSPDRRLELLDCATAFGVPVIEDDPYSELRYDGPPTPSLRALPGGEDVIYLGTFSKVLAPGLRLGWVVAPRPVIDRLVIAKQGADLHTDGLAQRGALRFCLDNDLDAHVIRLREVYRERRDAMLDALRECLPDGTTWTEPAGGMFTWVTLPAGLDSRDVLKRALANDVAFVPGTAFHVNGGGERSLRLNFTNSTPERIWEGIGRLARSL
jgi:2-aminoadipate transaminase